MDGVYLAFGYIISEIRVLGYMSIFCFEFRFRYELRVIQLATRNRFETRNAFSATLLNSHDLLSDHNVKTRPRRACA